MQDQLMKFDPAFGTERPYPSHAAQWRKYHGQMAWLINPWTGGKRHPGDVGTDPFGHGMRASEEPLVAAQQAQGCTSVTAAEYRNDIYDALGVQGHAGAIAEISALRKGCGLGVP